MARYNSLTLLGRLWLDADAAGCDEFIGDETHSSAAWHRLIDFCLMSALYNWDGCYADTAAAAV